MATELQESTISSTSKDFQAVYPELLTLARNLSATWNPTVSNEADPGVVLIKELAIAIDKINYNTDKNALENYPLSVTTQELARQLFRLLGYFPKWYRSARASIAISWTGEDIKNDKNSVICTLPLFTQIKDDNGNYTYTIIGKPSFTLDSTQQTQEIVALEGSIKRLSINNKEIITIDMLDENNRVYIEDYTVAQNGIFISNVYNSEPTLNFWEEVDNLSVQSLGQQYYSFGVDTLSGKCYIEFPIDISSLIDQGLAIYYIVSQGSLGNAPIGILNNLFDSTIIGTLTNYEIDGSSELELNAENFSVSNIGLLNSGKDPETIDESYQNYKKIVGTFDTLITLRDYCNAIYNTGEVSNGFVCDRTNDIQNSYRIMTQTADLTTYVHKQKSGGVLQPFDLKIYALQYNDILGTKPNYDNTFQIYTSLNATTDVNSKLYQLTQLLDDMKCVQHDFADLQEDKICLIKNKYVVGTKIVPVTGLTDLQKLEIRYNIAQTLYNKYNAREVDFGQKIDYDNLYNIIKEADSRIKSLIVDNIEYDTYVVYYDSGNNGVDAGWKEICVSDEHTGYLTGYYNNNQFYDYKVPIYQYNYTTTSANTPIFENPDGQRQVGTITQSGVSLTSTEQYTSNSQNWIKISYGTVSGWIQVPDTLVSEITGYQYVSEFKPRALSSNYTYMDLSNGYIYTYDSLDEDGPFKLYSTMRDTFRTEIVAKNILAGITPYIEPAGTNYRYQLNQSKYQYYKDSQEIFLADVPIDNVTTETNADFKFYPNYSTSIYDVRDNEVIQFYKPALVTDTTYGSYVKYEFYSVTGESIPQNSAYALRIGEYFTVFYKELDDDEIYTAVRYYGPSSNRTEGAIICPTFTLEPTGSLGISGFNDANATTLTAKNNYSTKIYLSRANSTLIANSSSAKSLTASKNVNIQHVNEVTLDNENNYCYFVTNTEVTEDDVEYNVMNFYKHFEHSNENSSEMVLDYYYYVLSTNEYFIYTNASRTSMEILGAGTLIKVFPSEEELNNGELSWRVVRVDQSGIIQYGITFIEDYLKITPDMIIVTEQEFTNVLAGGEVQFGLYSQTPEGFKVSVDNEGLFYDTDPFVSVVQNPLTSNKLVVTNFDSAQFLDQTKEDQHIGENDHPEYALYSFVYTQYIENNVTSYGWKLSWGENTLDKVTLTDYGITISNIGTQGINTGAKICITYTNSIFGYQVVTSDDIIMGTQNLDSIKSFIFEKLGYEPDDSAIIQITSEIASEKQKLLQNNAGDYEYATLRFGIYHRYTAEEEAEDPSHEEGEIAYDDDGIPILETGKDYEILTWNFTVVNGEGISGYSNYTDWLYDIEDGQLVLNDSIDLEEVVPPLNFTRYWDGDSQMGIEANPFTMTTGADPNAANTSTSLSQYFNYDKPEYNEDPGWSSDWMIQLEFTSAQPDEGDNSIALSTFVVRYKEPDGTEGRLTNNLTENLNWKVRSYLALNCSTNTPQVLYDGQKITFISGETNSSFETVGSDTDPVYIVSSDALYVSGGESISLALVNNNYEIYYPTFYTYTIKNVNNTELQSDGSLKLSLLKTANTDYDSSQTYNFNFPANDEFMNLPNGDYLITLVNKCDDLTNLTITYGGTVCSSFNNPSLTNFNEIGVYYISFNIGDAGGALTMGGAQIANSGTLTITAKRYYTSNTKDESITIRPVFKYKLSDIISDSTDDPSDERINKDSIDAMLSNLDSDSLFDYTYVVDEGKKIVNPLASESFVDESHFYNPFTICQIDYINNKIVE